MKISFSNSKKIIINLSVFFILIVLNFYFRSFTFHYSTLDWDELTYFIMGKSIVSDFLPYRDYWDLKPVGIYFIHAVTLLFFDYSILTLRMSAFLFSTLIAFALFISLDKLRTLVRLLLSLVFLFCLLVFHSGLASNTELYFLFFEAISFYLIFITRYQFGLYLGFFLLGFAFLIKYIIVFDVMLFFLCSFFLPTFENTRAIVSHVKIKIRKDILKFFICVFLFSLPLLFSIFYYVSNNSFFEYFDALLFILKGHSRNVSWLERLQFLMKLKYLFGLVTLLLLIQIYYFKDIFKQKVFMIALFWVFTSSLGAIWTGFLYEHYLLAILFPLILVLGIVVGFLEQYSLFKKNIYFLLIWAILVFGFHAVKERKHLKKTLNQIPDQGVLVAKSISKHRLNSNNERTFFIANGSHAPYVLLNQLPPVKWIQPNNYSEKIFAKNLNLNHGEVFSSLEENSVSIITWCYRFSLEELLDETAIDNEISMEYVRQLKEYLETKKLKQDKISFECSLYYL